MSSCLAVMVEIRHGHGFNLISRRSLSCKHTVIYEMGPKLHDFEAKNEQVSDDYGQNKAWALIQFTAKLF